MVTGHLQVKCQTAYMSKAPKGEEKSGIRALYSSVTFPTDEHPWTGLRRNIEVLSREDANISENCETFNIFLPSSVSVLPYEYLCILIHQPQDAISLYLLEMYIWKAKSIQKVIEPWLWILDYTAMNKIDSKSNNIHCF